MEQEQTNTKRKKIVLTLEQKLQLIRRYEKGEKASTLAKEFDIGTQTARDIIKQKEKILTFIQHCDTFDGPTKRKSMKMSTYEELDASMLSWYNETRETGVPITSNMCMEQAKNLYEAIGFTGVFNASAGWFNRFKQRYGIVNDYTKQTFKAGCDKAANKFYREFRKLTNVEKWLPDQIYNADETGVHWNAMPHRSTGTQTGTRSQKSYDRITVMCCGNSSGTHKMRLAIVGKPHTDQSAPNPLSVHQLPVDYYEAKGSWMTKEIFQNWFETKWVPEVRTFLAAKGLPERALLLVDAAPFHGDEISLQTDDGCMIAKFIPPDAANMVQPMQQGIMSEMKWIYRTDLLKNVSKTATQHRTLVDALHELAQSWDKLSVANIITAWSKLIPDLGKYVYGEEHEEEEEEEEVVVMQEEMQEGEEQGEEYVEDTTEMVAEHHEPIKNEYGDEGTTVYEEQVEMVEWLDVPDSGMQGDTYVEIECGPIGEDEEMIVKTEAKQVEVEQEVTEEEIAEERVVTEEAATEEEVEERDRDNKRIQLHTALTSVEALLEFVDQRGLPQHDRAMLKKIQTDVRMLKKSCKK